jgi:hypothetical protein
MSTFTDTYWLPTLHLNAVRALSAAITLTVLYVVGRLTGILSGPQWTNMPVGAILVMPAALLVIGVAVILIFRLAASMGVPMTGGLAFLMSLMMVVFIAIGDPLIWIVRKYYPAIVPSRSFHIINPKAVILVQKDVDA